LGAIEQVGLGLVVLLLGAMGGWVLEHLRRRYRYRALRTVLRGRNRLQIAVSSIELESFTFTQGGAVIVHNNPPTVRRVERVVADVGIGLPRHSYSRVTAQELTGWTGRSSEPAGS